MEKRVYEYMNEDIKEVVIRTMEYRVQRTYLPTAPKDWVERQLKHELLDGLAQFVRVDFDDDRRPGDWRAEASIHMPYIRDARVADLEQAVHQWRLATQERGKEVSILKARMIEWRSKPWYVRVWAALRNKLVEV